MGVLPSKIVEIGRLPDRRAESEPRPSWGGLFRSGQRAGEQPVLIGVHIAVVVDVEEAAVA